MILFGASVSPFVRKVLMVAAEKGISLENRPVVPNSDDPAYLAASPFKKIPAFQDGDYTLADSTAIVAYLEAKAPTPAMYPSEARERGKAVWFEEFSDTIMFPAVTKIFFNRVVAPKMLKIPGDQARADDAHHKEVPPLFDYLEGVVSRGDFLVGKQLSIADISIVNQLANLAHGACKVDAAQHPALAAYYARLSARPSIAGILAAEKAMLGT
jgi:glutathione S-transferase